MATAKTIKAKYYTKEVLKYLLLCGVFTIAASSPNFSYLLMKKVFSQKKIPKRKAVDTFSYLKRRGLIELKRDGYDMEMALTPGGRKLAGKYQIDDLEIQHPKEWDGKWRLVIFDIPTTSNTIRNVFRRKLKELGFFRLQKSIWIYPFPCQEEIKLLREFLEADKKQIQVLEVSKLEDDQLLRKIFQLKPS